jgi:GTP-binding protein
VGLGHAFLRHIRRCGTLCIILDMAGIDDRDPWDDYKKILSELEQYDPELVAKPHLVAANKMDENTAESNLKEFRQRWPEVEVMEIMAAIDEGIPELKERFRQAAKS